VDANEEYVFQGSSFELGLFAILDLKEHVSLIFSLSLKLAEQELDLFTFYKLFMIVVA
jgi:hypothetical protein